jgi:hypothetical protein
MTMQSHLDAAQITAGLCAFSTTFSITQRDVIC